MATALLLPKDVEDRTLYTILAKPVPRFDYLAGKLLGVLLLVFVSLALMDVLMTAVLQIRTSMVRGAADGDGAGDGLAAGRDRLAARGNAGQRAELRRCRARCSRCSCGPRSWPRWRC